MNMVSSAYSRTGNPLLRHALSFIGGFVTIVFSAALLYAQVAENEHSVTENRSAIQHLDEQLDQVSRDQAALLQRFDTWEENEREHRELLYRSLERLEEKLDDIPERR